MLTEMAGCLCLWVLLAVVNISYCCVSEADIENHPCASLASLLGEDLSTLKRGSGWGWPSKTVGAELKALPVAWWYDWGNYIPDESAQNHTKVIAITPLFTD